MLWLRLACLGYVLATVVERVAVPTMADNGNPIAWSNEIQVSDFIKMISPPWPLGKLILYVLLIYCCTEMLYILMEALFLAANPTLRVRGFFAACDAIPDYSAFVTRSLARQFYAELSVRFR